MDDQVKSAIAESVKAAMEPLAAMLNAKQAPTVITSSSDTPVIPDNAKFGMFAKGVLQATKQKDFSTLEKVTGKTVNTLVDAEGGYLVPEGWDSMIWRVAQETGITSRVATIMNGVPARMHFPTGASNLTAGFVGETAVISPADPTFGEKILEPKKIAAATPISNESLADSLPNLSTYLQTLLGEAVAVVEDTKVIAGDGTGISGIYGVFKDPNVTDVPLASGSTFASVTFEDIVNLYNAYPVHLLNDNCAFIMSQSVMGLVQKLKTTTNEPIFQNLYDGVNYRLLGRPVIVTNYAPTVSAANTPFIAFGDFKRASVVGYRGGVSLSVFDQYMSGQDLAGKDLLGFRITRRMDYRIILPSLIKRLKTNA